jgi:hypothetical protein
VLLFWLALGFTGCNQDDVEATWVRFNNDEDFIEIEVEPGAVGDEILGDVTSTTGETVVGSIRVTPGSGPVGTEHTVVVQVLEAYEERVARVDIKAVSDDRGNRIFTLQQDSAELGVWVAELVSYGVDDEVRVDRLEPSLYELQEIILPDEEPGAEE